jgi:hypothetical protein
MKRLLSMLFLQIAVVALLTLVPVNVNAQKVIEDTITPACASALSAPLSLFGSLTDLVNPSANLPFTPAACGKDKGGYTTALPVKYLPFVLLRVYKAMISFAVYLFGLSIIILGVMIQLEILQGDVTYWAKIRKAFSSSITGLLTVLFAYYVVQIILYIFNIESVLSEGIIKP